MQTSRESRTKSDINGFAECSSFNTTACKRYRKEAKNKDRTRQNTAKGTITTLCLNYVDIHVKYFMIFNHTIYFPYIFHNFCCCCRLAHGN